MIPLMPWYYTLNKACILQFHQRDLVLFQNYNHILYILSMTTTIYCVMYYKQLVLVMIHRISIMIYKIYNDI